MLPGEGQSPEKGGSLSDAVEVGRACAAAERQEDDSLKSSEAHEAAYALVGKEAGHAVECLRDAQGRVEGSQNSPKAEAECEVAPDAEVAGAFDAGSAGRRDTEYEMPAKMTQTAAAGSSRIGEDASLREGEKANVRVALAQTARPTAVPVRVRLLNKKRQSLMRVRTRMRARTRMQLRTWVSP